MVSGPLDGIRILDFTLAMAGPFATQKLGDMGADVVKVEPTGKGEWHRSSAAADVWGVKHNASFLSFNRNKRSLSLDLKAPHAADIIRKLVERSDAVIQNFRPGVAERLGIDYESLRQVKPDLVYCSISGYGESGPYRERVGQDLLLQGMSGAMWNTGTQDDPPQSFPVYACDATAAHLAVEGLLAALLRKERSGEGQKVEVDLFSGIVDMQAQELSVYFLSGVNQRRTKEPLAHTYIAAPYGVYPTSDGYIVISLGSIPELGKLFGDEELERMTETDAGSRHRDRVFQIVSSLTPKKSSEEWLELLTTNGFWAGPIYDYDTLASDPQVAHNRMIVEIDHPVEGRIKQTGIPIRFSGTPGSVRRHQPDIGEDSREILGELGYAGADIENLTNNGTIQIPSEESEGDDA